MRRYQRAGRGFVRGALLITGAVSFGSASVQGQSPSSAAWGAYVLGTQFNLIAQRLARFRSPYESVNSLKSRGDTQASEAYGAYLGAQMGPRLQGYLDVEMIRGNGISNATGLAGVTNGDVIRQGSVDLGKGPYVARAYLRYTLPLASADSTLLSRAPDQIEIKVPTRRVEITAGKLALSDLFDVNAYATSTRFQFQNWGLWQNTAWDFAADTRGYSNGVAVAWFERGWTLRVASFQMPTRANGNILDHRVLGARGDQAELTMVHPRRGTVVRLLSYINHAQMGSYADALAVAKASGAAPDIVADDKPGRTKYGFGLNVEQPLADSAATGLFARLGWNDGKNESFAFTEVDAHSSAGFQISGAHWRRHADQLGVGYVRHGLSTLHRKYLEAGGSGFLLGDGALDYGHEQILEAYYRVQLGAYTQLSTDVQRIWNPGYNRDRGPALVYALRVNFRF